MNEHDYQQLSQYLDGELDMLTARRVEQRLAAEPALAATLEQMREQQAALRAAFEGQEAVPASVVGLLKSRENVVALPRQAPPRPAWHYALAASLVAGIGLMLSPPWQAPDDNSSIASVLETSPSMADDWATLDNGMQVRPVLSFRDNTGTWCREYVAVVGGDASRGVACRDGGQWQVRFEVASDLPGSTDQFRPAGAGDSDTIGAYLDEHAAGIALSAEQEAELIERGWR